LVILTSVSILSQPAVPTGTIMLLPTGHVILFNLSRGQDLWPEMPSPELYNRSDIYTCSSGVLHFPCVHQTLISSLTGATVRRTVKLS
jgi:hypothetical protein